MLTSVCRARWIVGSAVMVVGVVMLARLDGAGETSQIFACADRQDGKLRVVQADRGLSSEPTPAARLIPVHNGTLRYRSTRDRQDAYASAC